MKKCKRCGKTLVSDAFSANRIHCRKCRVEPLTPAERRGYQLRIKFGITTDDYDRMLSEQGGTCANPGCSNTAADQPNGKGGPRRYLNIDHDHGCCPGQKTCGRCIRGLLCWSCNTSLGILNDDVDRIQGLLDYLTQRTI